MRLFGTDFPVISDSDKSDYVCTKCGKIRVKSNKNFIIHSVCRLPAWREELNP
jgi:hypothetical protein